MTNGNFDVQLPVHDKDEFDELADDFNKMTNSLKESQAEIEEQKIVEDNLWQMLLTR